MFCGQCDGMIPSRCVFPRLCVDGMSPASRPGADPFFRDIWLETRACRDASQECDFDKSRQDALDEIANVSPEILIPGWHRESRLSGPLEGAARHAMGPDASRMHRARRVYALTPAAPRHRGVRRQWRNAASCHRHPANAPRRARRDAEHRQKRCAGPQPRRCR